MRIVGEIPHPIIKITVFKNDGKFSIKCETGLLEQMYKFRDDERLQSFEDLQNIVDQAFIQKIEETMQVMYEAKKEGMQRHLTPIEDEFEKII
jgi:DNA-binding MltR family transcriptional regulator